MADFQTVFKLIPTIGEIARLNTQFSKAKNIACSNALNKKNHQR